MHRKLLRLLPFLAFLSLLIGFSMHFRPHNANRSEWVGVLIFLGGFLAWFISLRIISRDEAGYFGIGLVAVTIATAYPATVYLTDSPWIKMVESVIMIAVGSVWIAIGLFRGERLGPRS